MCCTVMLAIRGLQHLVQDHLLCSNTSCYQAVFIAELLSQAEAVSAESAIVVHVKACMHSCGCNSQDRADLSI